MKIIYLRKQAPQDFTPLSWETYFTTFQDVEIDVNKFRVYTSGGEGPVIVLLHGGGYSGLTWSLFTREIIKKIQCKVAAIDIRGHGETHTTDEDNLSIETLTKDVTDVLQNLYGVEEAIILVGHSMGGALAVHCAQNMQNCVGLCVIDVVEGTAMESLSSMQTILRNRPNSFVDIEHAVQWCLRSGQTQNCESARVSMPSQIKNSVTGKLASSEVAELADAVIDADLREAAAEILKKQTPGGIEAISEDQEDEQSTELVKPAETVKMKPPNNYTWRIDLSKTEVYWRGWFQGLSELFLCTPCPKLLLLANIHGLDTALTVGQMQGKFQMQVLPRCGHAIHEDLPDRVADIIATFLVRQKITVALSDFTPLVPGC